MITLEFNEEPCNECDCCFKWIEAVTKAGSKNKKRDGQKFLNDSSKLDYTKRFHDSNGNEIYLKKHVKSACEFLKKELCEFPKSCDGSCFTCETITAAFEDIFKKECVNE